MVIENQEMVMEKSWTNILSSLWEPCYYMYAKVGTCSSNRKQDIHVQKIKVKKLILNSPSLHNTIYFVMCNLPSDRGKSRLLFDVLLYKILHIVSGISAIY